MECGTQKVRSIALHTTVYSVWCTLLLAASTPYARLSRVAMYADRTTTSVVVDLLRAVFTTDVVGYAGIWILGAPLALLVLLRLSRLRPTGEPLNATAMAFLCAAWGVLVVCGVRALALSLPVYASPILDSVVADLLLLVALGTLLVAGPGDLAALLLCGPTSVVHRRLRSGAPVGLRSALVAASGVAVLHLPSLLASSEHTDGFTIRSGPALGLAAFAYVVVTFFVLLLHAPNPLDGWSASCASLGAVVALNFNVCCGALVLFAWHAAGPF